MQSLPQNKKIVYTQKVGPAFQNAEIDDAHLALDDAGAPREINGYTLSLAQRVKWLHNTAIIAAEDCGCVVPEQSCPVCRAQAANVWIF